MIQCVSYGHVVPHCFSLAGSQTIKGCTTYPNLNWLWVHPPYMKQSLGPQSEWVWVVILVVPRCLLNRLWGTCIYVPIPNTTVTLCLLYKICASYFKKHAKSQKPKKHPSTTNQLLLLLTPWFHHRQWSRHPRQGVGSFILLFSAPSTTTPTFSTKQEAGLARISKY